MRLWSVFRKSVKEQLREPWGLLLTLGTAPFFVLLYWLFFGGASFFRVLVVEETDTSPSMTTAKPSQAKEAKGAKAGVLGKKSEKTDAGGGRGAKAKGEDSLGVQLVRLFESLKHPGGGRLLKASLLRTRGEAERELAQRQAAAAIILPRGFSSLLTGQEDGDAKKKEVKILGDFTDPSYASAAMILQQAIERFIREATQTAAPMEIKRLAVARSDRRTAFESYIPGLLILSVVMLIFSAAMTVTYEVEMGTLRRLQLSKLSAFSFLGGISLSQVLLGTIAISLTFLMALSLGFRSQGALWVAILVGALTSLSIMGIGMIVASFARSVTEAFLLSNFPLFLLMFFSGAIRPIPKLPLFALGGREIGLYDFLQPTHAVVALNKILTLGASLGDVLFELAAVLILAALYFVVGVILFHYRRMRVV